MKRSVLYTDSCIEILQNSDLGRAYFSDHTSLNALLFDWHYCILKMKAYKNNIYYYVMDNKASEGDYSF